MQDKLMINNRITEMIFPQISKENEIFADANKN